MVLQYKLHGAKISLIESKGVPHGPLEAMQPTHQEEEDD